MNLRFDKYKTLSEDMDKVSIDYLANAVMVKSEEAMDDIRRMVSEGMFGRDAYIDYCNRSLVLKRERQQERQRQRQEPVQSALPEVNNPPIRKWLIIGGIALIILGPGSIGIGYFDGLGELLGTAVCWGGAIALFVGAGRLKKRTERFKKLSTALSGRFTVWLPTLADEMRAPLAQVTQDVKQMLSRGLLGATASLSDEGDTLFMTSAARPEPVRKPRPEPQPAEKREPQPAPPQNEYYSIIVEIRELNEAIIDYEVSEKIDQIEDITAKIFRTVEESPDKKPKIRKFMSYYLPTTLKLLHSYSVLEKQGVGGENIDATKKSIENSMGTLVMAFKKQLDQLFTNDAMDINADLDVLETMIKNDNLKE